MDHGSGLAMWALMCVATVLHLARPLLRRARPGVRIEALMPLALGGLCVGLGAAGGFAAGGLGQRTTVPAVLAMLWQHVPLLLHARDALTALPLAGAQRACRRLAGFARPARMRRSAFRAASVSCGRP